MFPTVKYSVFGSLHEDFVAGVKDAIVAATGLVPFAMLVGITMIEVGLTGTQAVFMSAFMFSGAAQLTAIELLAVGSSPVVIVLAALVVNSRFMMFSASIAPYFARFSMKIRWVFAYFLADLHFALTMTKYKTEEISIFWYYFGSAVTVYSVWVFSTLLGVLVGARLPEGLELDFAITLVFLFLLLSLVDTATDIVAATIAGSLAVAAAGLPHDVELLVTPLIGVLLGYAIKRRYLADE